MAVNKFTFNINTKDPTIQLGFGTTFDEAGREDLIKVYEDDVVRQLVNPTKDFEVTRFRHAPLANNTEESPDIFYQFNFFDSFNTTWSNPLPAIAPTQPLPFGFNFKGYTNADLAENTSDLLKSFFKLDFYDSNIKTRQKFYMSNLLSPVNGTRLPLCAIDADCRNVSDGSGPANITTDWGALNMNVPDGPILDASGTNTILDTTKDVPIPRYQFDMDNKSIGYFFYWLKESTYLNINTFFMSAKFYNGRDGKVVRFTNVLPTTLPNQTSFDAANNMYYKLLIDKNNFTYWIEDLAGTRVGTSISSPIEFWEYVNPT
jgi:hypothetical protein|tara:strand:- start:1555 stop:2505 length:951 start_codon:yes stop_codon:yes gene_type:complete